MLGQRDAAPLLVRASSKGETHLDSGNIIGIGGRGSLAPTILLTTYHSLLTNHYALITNILYKGYKNNRIKL